VTALHRLLGGAAAAVTNPVHATVTATTAAVSTGNSSQITVVDSHSLTEVHPFLYTKFDEQSFLFSHCYCVFAHVMMHLCYKIE